MSGTTEKQRELAGERLHRVFLVMAPSLRCASCGAVFSADEVQEAAYHTMNGGPKTLVEVPTPYPCTEEGCDFASASERGLAMHRAKAHKGA